MFTLTRDEYADAKARLAALTQELADAEATAQDASERAHNQPGTDQILYRIANEAADTVKSLRTRHASLSAFMHSAQVEPVRTPLTAQVRRESQPPVRRTITARHAGICRICQRMIKPGDRITSWMSPGCWAHADEAAQIERQSAEQYRTRTADRALADQIEHFIERLPSAA